MSAGAERVATGELVERARRIAGQFTGGNLPLIPPSLLTALADRLAELEALEPVRRLLAAMEAGRIYDLRVSRVEDAYVTVALPGPVETRGYSGDTLGAALRALADAVGEGRRA